MCINFRRYPQSLTGVFIAVSPRPPVRVMWSAERDIVDSHTVNLGPSDVPGQNFAGAPDRATYVNIRSA